MILELADAKKLDPAITQRDLNAYEAQVRTLTNNHFHVLGIRLKGLNIDDHGMIELPSDFPGLFEGDTVEISGTHYNNGLYTIAEIEIGSVKLNGNRWVTEKAKNAYLTLVRYPDDILAGVSKLIAYNVKMASKTGLKSKTIARMSETYYDVNASDNLEGFPKSMWSFLDKYRKFRWS